MVIRVGGGGGGELNQQRSVTDRRVGQPANQPAALIISAVKMSISRRPPGQQALSLYIHGGAKQPSWVSVAGPTMWNSLPGFILETIISADCFRRLLKTYLFARY